MDRNWLAAAFIALILPWGVWGKNKPLKAFFAHHGIHHTTRFKQGGSCDMVYKADGNKGPLVVRVMRRTRSLQKRCQIIGATKWAAQEGIGPSVIWHDPECVAVATAYITGEHPSPKQLKAKDVWHKLASLILKIHKSRPSFIMKSTAPLKKNTLKRWQEVERYVPKSHIPMWQSLKSRIQNIPTVSGRSFIHGDLKMDNLFLKKGLPMLIDWGETGYGSPYDDLGALFYHTRPSTLDIQAFMATYLGHMPTTNEMRIIQHYSQLAALNDHLWKARIFCKTNKHNEAAIVKRLDFFKRFL